MKLSKSREKYLLQKHFNTKSEKNIPNFLSQFGCRDSDTSDEDLFFITQYVTAVEMVVLGGSLLTETGLRYLKNLQEVKHLDLRSLPLNKSNLQSILHFKNLEYLDVKNTQISAQEITVILENFKFLKTFRIDVPSENEADFELWKKQYPNCELIINLI